MNYLSSLLFEGRGGSDQILNFTVKFWKEDLHSFKILFEAKIKVKFQT